MKHYDPEETPNPGEWLELDEQERIILAEQYHLKKRIEVPQLKMHAIVHAAVENQIAVEHEPVVRAMSRLTSAGLSRHDALHAIGSVLAEHLFDAVQGEPADANPMARYDAAVNRLTAKSWRRG